MIIILTDSKANHAAAQQLVQVKQDTILHMAKQMPELKEAEDQLVLIDIDTNDHFFKKYAPIDLANILLDQGLPDTINSVVFLVPDVNRDQNLRTFSREFIDPLMSAFKHPVTAYVPTDLSYASTFFSPPTQKDALWHVYGLQDRPKVNKLTMCLFQKSPDKEQLWAGKDILSWLINDSKAVKARPKDYYEYAFPL